jgi:hypothetical protein
VIILVIFWFAACYSILQAKGQLKLADDKRPKAIILKAIILPRESVMSIVANSSDAFDDKSILVWFVMLVQNVLGLIMTMVIATRFISFLPQPKPIQRSRQGRARPDKQRHVTSLQQPKEFVIPTNLEAVNYGNNIGPDWSIGTGGIGGCTFGTLVSGPRFLIKDRWPRPLGTGGRS